MRQLAWLQHGCLSTWPSCHGRACGSEGEPSPTQHNATHCRLGTSCLYCISTLLRWSVTTCVCRHLCGTALTGSSCVQGSFYTWVYFLCCPPRCRLVEPKAGDVNPWFVCLFLTLPFAIASRCDASSMSEGYGAVRDCAQLPAAIRGNSVPNVQNQVFQPS